MSTTQTTIIGSVSLAYNKEGELEMAAFHPKLTVNYNELSQQLGDCKNKTLTEIEQCAQLFLAAYFNKVSAIELRDVEKSKIIAQVVGGSKFENGSLREVELEFTYKEF